MIEKSENESSIGSWLKKLVIKRKDNHSKIEVNNTPKDIFEEKIKSPDYQNKISSIIKSYGLEDPECVFVDDKYIDHSESNNKFFVNINYSFESLDKHFFEENKPQFVIFVSTNGDDRGSLGDVYIPIDDEVRLVNYDYLFAFGGGASDKIEGLDYELLNPQNHNPDPQENWFNSHRLLPSKSQIFIYGQKGADISLLKTHIGVNWVL